jgi:hypothetical protein
MTRVQTIRFHGSSRDRLGFLAALGLAALLASSTSGADLQMDQVPVLVKEAAKKAVPEADWKSVTREKSTGRGKRKSPSSYELSGKNSMGRDVFVKVSATGQVLEVVSDISLSDVPKAVTDELKLTVSDDLGFEPKTVRAIAQKGRLIGFQFDGDYQAKTEQKLVAMSGKMTVRISADCKVKQVITPPK